MAIYYERSTKIAAVFLSSSYLIGLPWAGISTSKLKVSGLVAADALYLAGLAHHAAPLAVVCASAWDANRLTEELRWFDPGLRVCAFPDWETLPYDSFSPHPDLISERLGTPYQISHR